MFKGLFGGKGEAAQRGEDSVWMNHAARLQGMGREVGALIDADRSVVVVALRGLPRSTSWGQRLPHASRYAARMCSRRTACA